MTLALHCRALADALDAKKPWPGDGDVIQPWYEIEEFEMGQLRRVLRDVAATLEALGNSE